MRIQVNPETDSSGFGYVEPGQYTLRVVSCVQKDGPKAPYLNWACELIDPNVPTVTGKGKPGHIFVITSLNQENNAQFQLRRMSEALGLPWEDFDTDEVAGLEFEAILGTHEHNDTITNEVKKFIAKA